MAEPLDHGERRRVQLALGELEVAHAEVERARQLLGETALLPSRGRITEIRDDLDHAIAWLRQVIEETRNG